MTEVAYYPSDGRARSTENGTGTKASNHLILDFEQVVVTAPPLLEGADDEKALKEWIWHNCKDEILGAVSIQQRKHQEATTTQQRLSLLDQISCVQRQYLQMETPCVVFGTLLTGLLELMGSEYGFIGEVFLEDDGETPYLQTHAITNIAWNTATQAFYEENKENGLKFTNMKSLFGHVIVNEQPVISNTPKTDDRATGVPEGHPPLNHFLGIPFFEQGGTKMNGMVGIANKPGGYTKQDIEFLEPFVVTCSNLIQAYGAIRENQHLVKTLEDKVLARTNELELTNDRLEQANIRLEQTSAKQLQHFACMSHEIRTPLNCIIGMSSLLMESDLNSMQQESLKMMVTSGELLLTVVNDVLDYSKLESGNVDISIQRTSLQDTLDAVVHSINMKAQEAHISIATFYDPSVPEFVETDSRRLQQILYNLLGNAVKFSNSGGVVELKVQLITDEGGGDNNGECSSHVNGTNGDAMDLEEDDQTCPHAAAENGDGASLSQHNEANGHHGENGDASLCPFSTAPCSPSSTPQDHDARCESKRKRARIQTGKVLRFIVKDYGKGIEKKNFKKIFEPFLQASGSETERVYGGTGLGLSITSKLAGQLGGKVSVDSEIGSWSEFTLDLRFNGNAAPIEKIGKSLQRTRILVVSCNSKERFASSVVDQYKIDVTYHKNCDQLVQSGSKLDGANANVCLVQEDLYDADAFERQLSKAPNSILLTFGPKYNVREAKGHFRSLVKMIPSVLMQSIASFVHSSTQLSNTAVTATGDSTKIISYDKLQVLIAEDNLVNQKVLVRMLKRLGLQHIDIVDNGQKAVDASAAKEYDLVFMDMQMPVMGGIEACQLIVSREANKTKVIFVTAHVSTAFHEEAEAAGGAGFISKPYNLQKIESFIRSLA